MEQSFGEFERRSEQEQAAMGVRVLMREGQWIGDVPDELRARYSQPRDYAEEKPPMRLYPADIKRPKRHVMPNRTGTGRPRINLEMPAKVRVSRGVTRTDVTVDDILGLQKCGFTRQATAKRLGASIRLIQLRLASAGLQNMHWSKRPDITEEMIIERWRSGMSVSEIAAEFGVERKLIHRRAGSLKDVKAALCLCECGRGKSPRKACCCRCARRKG